MAMGTFETYECCRCGAVSPPCDEALTLFARKHGWALLRRFDGSKLILEWYCPKCWKERESSGAR